MSFFKVYSETFTDAGYRNAIVETKDRFVEEILSSFDWISNQSCLMYGDVQSGKTSHVLGIVAEALDRGFEHVLFLTTDNTRLAEQTLNRVKKALPGANICGPYQEHEFGKLNNGINEKWPSVAVINKNANVLKRWQQYLAGAQTLRNLPLLIVDDEADAASLNNKINKGEVTPVNERLSLIRENATGCVYLHVTGTPQALILQAEIDGWRPDHVVSFEPGESYIGGEVLFGAKQNDYVRSFASGDESERLALQRAVFTFLISAAQLFKEGHVACNMLVHPSRSKEDHRDAKLSIREIVADFRKNFQNPSFIEILLKIWHESLAGTSGVRFDENTLRNTLTSFLVANDIEYTIVNSDNSIEDEDALQQGVNVVIGGDSLGRGLTIPALQTVFYSRTTKTPQADTLWQHARMFGYDRDKRFLRVFMPGEVSKLFREVHEGNESIKRQIRSGADIASMVVDLKPSVKPTRNSVLNTGYIRPVNGGVNYFASDPKVPAFTHLDSMLSEISTNDGEFIVSTNAAISVLEEFEVSDDDFPKATFIQILQDSLERVPSAKSLIVIRRNRRVTHGTGTLLSPTDRDLSEATTGMPILILYRVEDTKYKWAQTPIWVPNIKIPGNNVYHRVRA